MKLVKILVLVTILPIFNVAQKAFAQNFDALKDITVLTESGETVSLGSLVSHGKPLLLDITSSWLSDTRTIYQGAASWQQQYGLEILVVCRNNYGATVDYPEAILEKIEKALAIPIYFDHTKDLTKQFSLNNDYRVLFDKTGKLLATGSFNGYQAVANLLASHFGPATIDDFDGDGVIDSDDRCPTEAGMASNSGCQAEYLERIQLFPPSAFPFGIKKGNVSQLDQLAVATLKGRDGSTYKGSELFKKNGKKLLLVMSLNSGYPWQKRFDEVEKFYAAWQSLGYEVAVIGYKNGHSEALRLSAEGRWSFPIFTVYKFPIYDLFRSSADQIHLIFNETGVLEWYHSASSSVDFDFTNARLQARSGKKLIVGNTAPAVPPPSREPQQQTTDNTRQSPPKPPEHSVIELLGKEEGASTVAAFIKDLGVKTPNDQLRRNDLIFSAAMEAQESKAMTWYNKGIRIVITPFGQTHYLNNIALFNTATPWEAYSNPLPFGIEWQDGSSELLRKIGPVSEQRDSTLIWHFDTPTRYTLKAIFSNIQYTKLRAIFLNKAERELQAFDLNANSTLCDIYSAMIKDIPNRFKRFEGEKIEDKAAFRPPFELPQFGEMEVPMLSDVIRSMAYIGDSEDAALEIIQTHSKALVDCGGAQFDHHYSSEYIEHSEDRQEIVLTAIDAELPYSVSYMLWLRSFYNEETYQLEDKYCVYITIDRKP